MGRPGLSWVSSWGGHPGILLTPWVVREVIIDATKIATSIKVAHLRISRRRPLLALIALNSKYMIINNFF
jgi:hypothetical protein